ncbi:hypothetical protein N657DRAFT_117813 [Parathielavia appendiculata]|uniref:Uncharacterized protein n=1 Tax=Parathielavia appendiculata TaxID=2587402 RepID=A0AAN6TVZ0_9PEZI|nr:hypothetical protein N657DRAFT_117813 [Parathielavia appendiculata]
MPRGLAGSARHLLPHQAISKRRAKKTGSSASGRTRTGLEFAVNTVRNPRSGLRGMTDEISAVLPPYWERAHDQRHHKGPTRATAYQCLDLRNRLSAVPVAHCNNDRRISRRVSRSLPVSACCRTARWTIHARPQSRVVCVGQAAGTSLAITNSVFASPPVARAIHMPIRGRRSRKTMRHQQTSDRFFHPADP